MIKNSVGGMIPKKLFTIWIGDPSQCPHEQIDTWKFMHPEWEHTIYGNDTLHGRKWINQTLIDTYWRIKDYPAVADIMRHELLLEHGGLCHPADSICLHNTDELWTTGYEAYGVYENEKMRPGLVSPLYASVPDGQFINEIVHNLPSEAPMSQGRYLSAWKVTGNLYMKRLTDQRVFGKSLMILPSYYFNPIHYTGDIYQGDEKVYAYATWYSTTKNGHSRVEYKALKKWL